MKQLADGKRVLGIAALPLAILAQYLLDQRVALAGTLIILALVLFLLPGETPGRTSPKRHYERTPNSVSLGQWNWVMILSGLFLSLISFCFFGGNRLRWYGVVSWVVGIFLFVGGFGKYRRLLKFRLPEKIDAVSISTINIFLTFVTLLGGVFRLWEISGLPAEPGVDLPLVFMSVQEVLRGDWPIFFTLHPGREGLYIYYAALFIKLFGLGYPSLRIAAALIGTVTIPVVFILGRQLFGPRVGLFSAAFLALDRWHIVISRAGLRFVLMPLFSLLLVIAVNKALTTRKIDHWILVGLIFGAGFYTYNAWLIMPLALILMIVGRRVAFRDRERGDFLLYLLAAVVAFLVLIPLARFAIDEPQMYAFRVASRLTDQEVPLPDSLVETAWHNVIKTAAMFNWTGDGVAHINVPLKRQLGLVSGSLFMLGVGLSTVRWRENGVLLLALVCTCLPSTLALAFPEEVPNAGRASGAIGFACVLSAVALDVWLEKLARKPGGGSRKNQRFSAFIGGFLVLSIFCVEGHETWGDYFTEYRHHLAGANYPISSELVESIVRYGDEGKVYLISYPHFYDGNALRTQIDLEKKNWSNEIVGFPDSNAPWLQERGLVVFLLHPDDHQALNEIRRAYPNEISIVHYDTHGAPTFITLLADSEN